jgi:hypothetical protein
MIRSSAHPDSHDAAVRDSAYMQRVDGHPGARALPARPGSA